MKVFDNVIQVIMSSQVLKDYTDVARLLYAAGLHKIGSSAVNRYTYMELKDHFALMNAAYVQEDFASVGLNFLDQLSLMTARGWALENISFGLEQFRDELISKEILDLSPLERLAMDYRDIDSLLSGRVEESLAEDIRTAIDGSVREHYNTGRLQRFIERYNFRIIWKPKKKYVKLVVGDFYCCFGFLCKPSLSFFWKNYICSLVI